MSYLKKFLFLSLVGLIFGVTALAGTPPTVANITIVNNYKYVIGTNSSLYNPAQFYWTAPPATVVSGSSTVFTYNVCSQSNPNCLATSKNMSATSSSSNYITFGNVSGSTVDQNNSCTFYYSIDNCVVYQAVGKGMYNQASACSSSGSYDNSTNTCNFVFKMVVTTN